MSPIGRPHDPEAAGPRPQNEQAPAPRQAVPREPVIEAEPEPEFEPEGEEVEGADGVAAEEAAPASPEAPVVEEEAPSVEELVEELEAVIVQRDQYLELARVKQAEFENFRKQVAKRQTDHAEQAAAGLVTQLLPVLDAFDNGVSHGDESLVPLRAQLFGVLEKEGLVRVDPEGEPFDPNAHDAVAHEPGDVDEPTVAETLRAGYRWNGRLLRAAMVRVRG